jgi:hypothetical protein
VVVRLLEMLLWWKALRGMKFYFANADITQDAALG